MDDVIDDGCYFDFYLSRVHRGGYQLIEPTGEW